MIAGGVRWWHPTAVTFRSAQKSHRRALAVFAFLLLASAPARAVCVIMPLDYHLREDYFAAVFRGTVRSVQNVAAGQVVTFDVDRVWKGVVAPVVVLYNLTKPFPEEAVTFVPARRYLVAPHRLTNEERQQFSGIAVGPNALGTQGCDVYDPDNREILGTAAGYPPQRSIP